MLNIRLFTNFLIVLLAIPSLSLSLEVYTRERVTAVKGTAISILCNFSASTVPAAVYWYRHNSTGSPDSLATIVAQEFQGKDFIRGGQRYNITDDYSLVIRDVSVQDETTYSCLVVLEDGEDNRGYTNLRVIALATPLEPMIVSCEVISPGRCIFKLTNTPPQQVTLTCELHDVRPPANLTWIRGDGRLQETADLQRYESNGLYTISSQLQVSSYDYDYQYKCEAKGEAVNSISSMTAAFIVEAKGGLSGGLIFLIVLVALVVVAAIIVAICYKMYGFPCLAQAHPESRAPDKFDMEEAEPLNDTEREIARLRRNIKDYIPGKLTDRVLEEGRTPPDRIRLALVGETSAGKSSVIRSLKYAFSGQFNREIEISKRTAGGAVTLEPAFYKITDSIHMQDNRGMLDFDTQNVKGIMQQLENERVSLLIPIFRPEAVQHKGVIGGFLADLSKAIRDKFASYPLVILTHRDKITDPVERQSLREKIANMGVLIDNVKFVENFTEKPKDESMCQELIKEFLEVLHSMLIVADSNLVQQLNKGVEMVENGGASISASQDDANRRTLRFTSKFPFWTRQRRGSDT